MSGHSPKPTRRLGETLDSYLSRVSAWRTVPAVDVSGFRQIAAARTGGAAGIFTVEPPPLPTPVTATAEVPFAQTQEGLIFDFQQQQLLLEQQQRNALELDRQRQAAEAAREQARLAREREQAINQLQLDRERTFASLLQEDPVRATLFGLGFGPEFGEFTTRAGQLGVTLAELKGAREQEATTESALEKVLGRRVDIGQFGVIGLGTAQAAARAFIQGGADIQTLLRSAFGVGSLRPGEQPGLTAARLEELVREVTPVGLL